MNILDVVVIIPIYKPDEKFNMLLNSLKVQTVRPPLLIIDSGSDKVWQSNAVGLDYNIIDIKPQEFNHGGTRQMGIAEAKADVAVFLTQDAVLTNENSLKNIISVFADKSVGCAYGRQLPHNDATLFAAFARKFNYPSISNVRSLADKIKYGMKTPFISNSFAAYRTEILLKVGGFPIDTILAEDMCVAAKMLINGYKVAYAANAAVYHSHNYSILEEFKRYFDIGVFQATNSWIRTEFGAAEGEGKRFVISELRYLLKINWLLIIPMLMRDGTKWIGYRLGINYKCLPVKLCRCLSMTKAYWKRGSS